MYPQRESVKVLLTLRGDYVEALDKLIASGAATSRSELIEKIIGAFLADLKEGRKGDSALGTLVGFILLLLGVAVIASILGGERR